MLPAVTGARQSTIVRRVRRLLDDADHPLVGRHVLALCSGGADSVALVSLLGSLPRGAAPASLDVLWLDHAIREGVDAERAAAAAVAGRVGATFHQRRADVDLRRSGRGLEAAARAWRYASSEALAVQLGCDVVCTGHTASDQLEQALLALVGVTGAAGDVDAMRVTRQLDGDLVLVRPLLGLDRADVEAWCDEQGLEWSVDPTNADSDAHRRNAIRHKVVPTLLSLHPGAGVNIARTAQRRRSELDLTRSLAESLLDAWGSGARLDVRRLHAVGPRPVRHAVIAAWLDRLVDHRNLGSRIVRAVDVLGTGPGRSGSCARVDLPGDACVRRDGYDLVVHTDTSRGGHRP